MPRRPAPLKLRLAKGRGRGRDAGGRLVGPVPNFARYAPQKPDDLSPEASAHWDEVTPELLRADVVGPHMVGGLTVLCELWALILQARAAVAEQGPLLPGPRGALRRNPNLMTLEHMLSEYRLWCAEFALTPSGEGRLGVARRPASSGVNPFAPQGA